MFPDNLASRIDASGDCWIWTGKTDRDGYGRLSYKLAHRLVYTELVGKTSFQLDHLCRVRTCVNPDHLEPVTVRTNSLRSFSLPAQNARKQTCLRGHPLVIRNSAHGERRICRACDTIRSLHYQQRKKTA